MDNFKDGKSYDQNDSLITPPQVSGVGYGQASEHGMNENWRKYELQPNYYDP